MQHLTYSMPHTDSRIPPPTLKTSTSGCCDTGPWRTAGSCPATPPHNYPLPLSAPRWSVVLSRSSAMPLPSCFLCQYLNPGATSIISNTALLLSQQYVHSHHPPTHLSRPLLYMPWLQTCSALWSPSRLGVGRSSEPFHAVKFHPPFPTAILPFSESWVYLCLHMAPSHRCPVKLRFLRICPLSLA